MAQNEATSPHVQALTVPEAQALADRLFSRSQSTLFVASPEVRRDLCMASRAIRSMLHAIDRLASRCEDEAHLLRAFQVDVGGLLTWLAEPEVRPSSSSSSVETGNATTLGSSLTQSGRQ